MVSRRRPLSANTTGLSSYVHREYYRPLCWSNIHGGRVFRELSSVGTFTFGNATPTCVSRSLFSKCHRDKLQEVEGHYKVIQKVEGLQCHGRGTDILTSPGRESPDGTPTRGTSAGRGSVSGTTVVGEEPRGSSPRKGDVRDRG